MSRFKSAFRHICFLLIISCSSFSAYGDELDDQLEYLGRQQSSQVGSDKLIESYVALIESAGSDPRAVSAMLRVARLYGPRFDIRTKTTTHQRDKELEWYKRAAAAAERGSDYHLQALAGIKYLLRGPDRHQKAREIVAQMAELQRDNPVAMVGIEMSYMHICLDEKDYVQAAVHMNKIMHFEFDDSLPKKVADEKLSEIRQIQLSAIQILVSAWETRAVHLSYAERIRGIEKLMKDHFSEMKFQQEGESAILNLSGISLKAFARKTKSCWTPPLPR